MPTHFVSNPARPAYTKGWRNTGQYYLVDHWRNTEPVAIRIYELVDRNKYKPHTGKKQLAKAMQRMVGTRTHAAMLDAAE